MSKPGKYERLDEAILAAMKDYPNPFFLIAQGDVGKVASELSGAKYPAMVIDRRLQVLRKAGKIINVRGQGWMLAEGESA